MVFWPAPGRSASLRPFGAWWRYANGILPESKDYNVLTARTCIDMLRNMSMSVPKIFIFAIVVIAAFGAVLAGHLPLAAASSVEQTPSIMLARPSRQVTKASLAVYLKSPSPVDTHSCCFFCGHQSDTFEVCSPVSLRDHKLRGLTAPAKPAGAQARLTIYHRSPRIPSHHPRIASSLLELGCALTI